MSYPLTASKIEEVWQPYVNNAPVRLSTTSARPQRTSKASRKRKRVAKTGVYLIHKAVDTPTPRYVVSTAPLPPPLLFGRGVVLSCSCGWVGSFTVPQDAKNFTKIVNKGMPRSMSYRSIKALIVRTIVGKPEENQAIVHMLRLFLLGAYRHCTSIAPPPLRLEVYRKGPKAAEIMYNRIEAFTNKALYAVVSEYVIGMAKTVRTLYHILQTDPDWTEYQQQATTVCNLYLR